MFSWAVVSPVAFLVGYVISRWQGEPAVLHQHCTCWCDCDGTGRWGLAGYLALGAVLALGAERLVLYLRGRARASASPPRSASPSRPRPQLQDIASATRRRVHPDNF